MKNKIYKTAKKNNIFIQSVKLFLFFTLLCGVLYTLVLTAFGQLAFNKKANGSIIEKNGIKYGSELLGQPFEKMNHLWGRIMLVDVSSYKDKDGNNVLYAGPSNKSPKSDEYNNAVKERVEKIKNAHPEKANVAIPVDLVTCSASGLDPHISVKAAYYQAERLAKYNNIPLENVIKIIDKCTNNKFLGIFGEKTVNVLKVNLMLDNIL